MRLFAVVLVLAVAVGCSSGSSTTPAAAPKPLNLEILSDQSGLGCVHQSPVSGTGGRVTAKDEKGAIVGTGTLATAPGADTCDWVTTIPLSAPVAFVDLEGDKGKLTTLSAKELAAPKIVLDVGVLGDVRIVSP